MEALALETKVFFMGFPTRRHRNLWERGCFFSAQLLPGIQKALFMKNVDKNLTNPPPPKKGHQQWQFDDIINLWRCIIKILFHPFSDLSTLFASTCFSAWRRELHQMTKDLWIAYSVTTCECDITMTHIISCWVGIWRKVHKFAEKTRPSALVLILTKHSFCICAARFLKLLLLLVWAELTRAE